MSTGIQASRSTQKLQEHYPLLWSDGTAVSPGRSDEREDGAGFRVKVSGEAFGSGRQNASVPMNTSSTLSHTLVSEDVRSSAVATNEDSEVVNESQQTSSSNIVQFATYPPKGLGAPRRLRAPPLRILPNRHSKTWTPLPLRVHFWIPLIVILVGGGIGLEIALYFSNKHQGWPAGNTNNLNISTALHYAYTVPLVIIAATIVTLWAWTDIEIKKIQPYVDLVHGDSPPHRSLLLDYTRYSNFFVWIRAVSNRHYLVALSSLMAMLTLSLTPLASTLLIVTDMWLQEPDVIGKNLGTIGLNQNLQITDLTAFVTGAGFAGAFILYNLPTPPFVAVPYTVAPFEMPPITKNSTATAFVNTTAVKTSTGCQTIQVNKVKRGDGSGGWNNSASSNGCSITWEVSPTSDILFGADVPTCDADHPPQYSPVVFWFFKYKPSAMASATFCYPSISILEVLVMVDTGTGNVTKISEIRPFSQQSNVTGYPLYGRAYNGIKFDHPNPDDQFVLGRQNATQLQLPAAIYQAATQSAGGYIGNFDGGFSKLSDKVYGIYLALVAQQIYFVSDSGPINVGVRTMRKRVYVNHLAAHMLATALLILAFFATIIHLFHRANRRDLKLRHEPGTIASAISIGAQTGIGDVLAGRHAEDDIKEALRNKKFRIDPVTMKIIMEGEDGYESATSPSSPFYEGTSIRDLFSGSRANRQLSRNHPFAAAVTPTKTPLEFNGLSWTPLGSNDFSWTPLELYQHSGETTLNEDISPRSPTPPSQAQKPI